MLENVPRKEKQFRNFTVNSLRLKGPNGEKVKGDIWALLVKVRDDEKQKKEEEESKRKQQQSKPSPEKEEEKDKDASKVSSSSDDEPSSKGSDALNNLPSEKVATKAVKKAVKKAGGSMKFKALRKQVQETLAFKTDKDGDKKWKKLLQQCVDANPKKFALDGKVVSLAK